MSSNRSLSVFVLLLLVTLRGDVHGQQEPSATSSSLRGGGVRSSSSSSSASSAALEQLPAAAEVPSEPKPVDAVTATASSEATPVEDADLVPAEYAVYKHVAGDVEITVHRVPVQKLENGEEMDPWMQRAIAEGIDLNDYNVTYEGGTWETLEDDHRRHLVSVNAWENNDARYCQYERQKRGIQTVNWSYDLIQQAQMQAAYMARVQHIEHRTNLAAGIDAGWRIICENVSQNINMGYNGAHTALMNDQGHRDNILNVRVNKIGVGVQRTGPYFYLCEIFKGTT